MTLAQLRAFVAVAATGSVHSAAAQLVVSQPAVSAAIAALQRDLGIALVAREGRGIVVTPAGRVYERYARQVLGLLDEGREAAAGRVHPERGRLRAAAVTTAGEHVLPRFVASFRAHYPEAEIVLEVGNRSRVMELLEHREVDLFIGGRPPADGTMSSVARRRNALAVVAPPDQATRVRRRHVPAAELAAQVWLLREPGSGTRATTEEFFQALGISPRTLTIGSNGAIRESVLAGLGVTLISHDAVARELAEHTLQEWRGPNLPIERAWHVVTRAGEQIPATAELFVTELVAGGSPWSFRLEREARRDPSAGSPAGG
jgi:DNA-binding transcriptional LysR family regulator